MTDKIRAWIRLAEIKDMNFQKTLKLVDEFGEPDHFIGKKHEGIQKSIYLSSQNKTDLADPKEPHDWGRICKLVERYDIQFISYLDEEYPSLLKSIYSAPLYLFYRGKITKADLSRNLAIVGTRKATNYGKTMAKEFATTLAKSGFTIISGLAYGIDTMSHKAALEAGGRTIAVMATGCDQIYPQANKELAEMIVENGCLLSEYNPGQKAEMWNFPARNRIISGLSLGTLVVEGNQQSGALLTAKFALDQNRDLFALPGDINREESSGPNSLIRMGAKCVTSSKDILDEYHISVSQDEQQYFFPELSPKEDKIYQYMLQNRPEVYFDQLIVNTGYTVGELSTLLLSLELKKVIQRLPGSKFSLVY
ncbi:MAG TPA: DNA-processing protein DprA [Candidatus Cloacimonadota bacterium]|nr:DNA-processing protein DprA [Candidatus Cloacimonadota bacterium]HPT71730.1 DNA-processing protein DprA [Candidatus Cloacimonadota bacterium]